jgi:hypothetical protein
LARQRFAAKASMSLRQDGVRGNKPARFLIYIKIGATDWNYKTGSEIRGTRIEDVNGRASRSWSARAGHTR